MRKLKGYSVKLEPHVIHEKAGNPRPLSRAEVAAWPDEFIAYANVVGNQTPFNREVVARELRRREAWDAPAAMAFRISIIALCVSAAGGLVSIYGTFGRSPALDPRCAAIERDMVSAYPLRRDDPSLFRALACRPQGQGSVMVSQAAIRDRAAHYRQ